LAVFDDDKQQFSHLAKVDFTAPVFPQGHAFRHTENRSEFLYFAQPYPLVRVKANLEDFRRPERYEAWTCLKEGSRLDRPQLDRDSAGRLRYGWKKNTPAVGPEQQVKLIAAGKMKRSEAWLQLRDRDTGKEVQAHAGSVYWNAHRKRWILIAVQWGGSSLLGEVWYAEADTPIGPWVYAVKIVTHERYSFYNPKQHPMFDKHGGRVIFFEGTYSHTFSGNPEQTPRYDYNQILYKLDLADPRLLLPVAVYDLGETKSSPRLGTIHANKAKADRPLAFFALDRPRRGMVSVHAPTKGDRTGGLRIGKPLAKDEPPEEEALFYAAPAEGKNLSETVPLYEWLPDRGGGARVYSTAEVIERKGYRRSAQPLCRVWRSPWGAAAPAR
jgi:hypothetical protein